LHTGRLQFRVLFRLRKQLTNNLSQPGGAERLIEDDVDRIIFARLVRKRRQHENPLIGRDLFDASRELITFDKWHLEVCHYQIELAGAEQGECLGAIIRLDYRVGALREQAPEGFSQHPVVFNEQNVLALKCISFLFQFLIAAEQFGCQPQKPQCDLAGRFCRRLKEI